MTSIHKNMGKRILAGGAAAVLSLSVVACSEAEDAATEAESVISDVTGENGGDGADTSGENGGDGENTSAEPTDEAQETGETGTDEADATDGEDAAGENGETGDGGMTEVEAADGSTLEIPTAVASAAESAGFGAPESMEEGPDGESLVAYENGDYIVHSEESGAQPLVGMIAETWMSEGGFDSSVGLPTAAEVANDDGNGWTQKFTQGTISWTADDSGEFSADIQESQ